MTVGDLGTNLGTDLGTSTVIRTAPPAQERAARASATAVLRTGTVFTCALMILPGLLSPDPVGNSLLGALVGLSATSLVALAAYVWRSYLVPYRRVRRLIKADAAVQAQAAPRHDRAWAA